VNSNFIDCNRLDSKAINAGSIVLNTTWYNNIWLGVDRLQTTAVASYALISVSTVAATAGEQAVFLSGAATEIATFSVSLPKDYKAGSQITPYISYSCTSATGSTGDIVFGLAWHEINSSPTTALAGSTNQQITVNGSTAILAVNTTYFAAMGTTSLKAGSVISGCLYRESTTTTSVALDAVVYGLGFLYQIDGMGSTYNTVWGK
jgi:hypothetical protein